MNMYKVVPQTKRGKHTLQESSYTQLDNKAIKHYSTTKLIHTNVNLNF